MLRESTQDLFAFASSFGTTTLQDTGLATPNAIFPEGMKSDFRIAAKMLSELIDTDEMPLRVHIMPIVKAPDTDTADIVAFTEEMKGLYDSDRLRVRSLKIHPAANMESYGTPFIDPYADKDTTGYFGILPAKIEEIVLEANKHGVDIVMHAWGDAEVRAGIDAFGKAREAGYSDARNSLHHVGFVHPDDIQRIIDLRIPLNVTPMFSTDWAGQDEIYERLLGRDKVHKELTLNPQYAREGVNVSISADRPSSGPPELQSPLYNIASAVTLRAIVDGDQSKPYPPETAGMAVEQAIRAVTIDAAWQLRMEDKIGSLKAGKYADLVILDDDLFSVEPAEIANIKVLGTTMDGEFRYRNGI